MSLQEIFTYVHENLIVYYCNNTTAILANINVTAYIINVKMFIIQGLFRLCL